MRILNQQEEVRTIFRKTRFLMIAISAGLLLVLGRLFWLQIYLGDNNLQKSKGNFLFRESIFPARGDIVTADGKMMATTSAQFRISVLPILFTEDEDPEENVQKLTSTLSLSDAQSEQILDYLRDCRGRCLNKPLLVKDEITKDDILKYSGYLTDIPGAIISAFYRRAYPMEHSAAHLTGYVSRISKQDLAESDNAYDPESWVGKTGLEKAWEKDLHGSYGETWHIIDYIGRRVDTPGVLVGEVPKAVSAQKGKTLKTSILSYLQDTAEKSFQDRSGAAVVMNVHTGAVLALYSSPSYDPNLLAGKRIPTGVWLEYSESILRPLTNKAVQATFFPGSTFKVIPALAGLESKVITPNTQFLCTGCLAFGNEIKCCWNKWGHAHVSLYRSLKESCDIYYYFLSERLGHHRLTEFARLFNVGQPTGIDLAGEEDGILPTVPWFNQNHRGQILNKGYTMNLGIGQGDIRMTPIQLALVYAAVANGGIILRPQVAAALVDGTGKTTPVEPEVLRAISLNDKNRKAVLKALWAVPNEPGGTAFNYIDHTIPYAAGKTGTSQIISKAERKQIDVLDEDRRSMTADDALFAAVFPYSDPEIVAVAVVESGLHGAEAAAPIVYRLLKSYYYRRSIEE